MCQLCEESEDGSMQSCQDCGILICFDVETADDVVAPAGVTGAGDLYCIRHASAHDAAEEREEYSSDGTDWDYAESYGDPDADEHG
jgi:hypothetical protein